MGRDKAVPEKRVGDCSNASHTTKKIRVNTIAGAFARSKKNSPADVSVNTIAGAYARSKKNSPAAVNAVTIPADTPLSSPDPELSLNTSSEMSENETETEKLSGVAKPPEVGIDLPLATSVDISAPPRPFESCSPAGAVGIMTRLPRFGGDGGEKLAAFLEEAALIARRAVAAKTVSAVPPGDGAGNLGPVLFSTDAAECGGEVALLSAGGALRCATPRGKFHVAALTRGIVLTKEGSGDAAPLAIHGTWCPRVVVFPAPAPQQSSSGSKKWTPGPDRGSVAVFHVRAPGSGDGVLYGKPRKSKKDEADGRMSYLKGKIGLVVVHLPPGEGGKKLVRAVSSSLGAPVLSPPAPARSRNGDVFASSCEGHAGRPYLQCHSGVDCGVLYLFGEGILFFKPIVFIPRDRIRSICCGGRGGSSTRYVDLLVTVGTNDDDEEIVEFTNISSEELPGVERYVKEVYNKSKSNGMEATKEVGNDDDTESDEDDDDYSGGSCSENTDDDDTDVDSDEDDSTEEDEDEEA